MISASEYISLAALLMLEGRGGEFPKDQMSLCQLFEQTYSYQCKDEWAEIVVKQLESWKAISTHEDRFAGKTFRMFKGTLTETISLLQKTELGAVILSAKYEGASWFKRVFDNQEYWNDLHAETGNRPIALAAYDIESDEEESDQDVDLGSLTVPASDRIVKVSDNHIAEIDEATEEVLKLVTLENSIGDQEGLREALIGQINAARELVRHGSVKVYLLHQTIVEALQYLIGKYAGTAIAEAAKILLTVYLTKVIGE